MLVLVLILLAPLAVLAGHQVGAVATVGGGSHGSNGNGHDVPKGVVPPPSPNLPH